MGEEMLTSGFVLNHLAGKAGMTPRGIDSPALLRKTPPQRSSVVEVFVFLLGSKQFGSSHEDSFVFAIRFAPSIQGRLLAGLSDPCFLSFLLPLPYGSIRSR